MNEEDMLRIRKDFEAVINMSPRELEKWLETKESRDVGWTRDGEDESVGHQSGRRIIQIKRTRADDLDEDDYMHMQKVIGYVHRHLAQGGPETGKETSKWRYSLMNWGHDPLK